jgi:hypothetical protein
MELKPTMVQNEEVSMTTTTTSNTERPMDAPLLALCFAALLAKSSRRTGRRGRALA